MIVVRIARHMHQICELVRLSEIQRNWVEVEEFREIGVDCNISRVAALVVIGNAEVLQKVGLFNTTTVCACRPTTSQTTVLAIEFSFFCSGI